MLETGIRQIRVALAMGFGRRMNTSVVERLVADVLATLEEFGSPGEDVEEMIGGPYADPGDRSDLQTAALRRTARRLHHRSAFYRERFDAAGVRPNRVTLDRLHEIPVTRKEDLVSRAGDFLCAKPYLSAQTTGTTGTPTRIWLSRYEVELWPAMVALSMLLRGEIRTDDCIQICQSSRATAGVQQIVTTFRLAGAAVRVVGQVPPEEAIDHLLDTSGAQPTILNSYPSYLGQLVTTARRLGHGPADFRLRAFFSGGEVLTAPLRDAAQKTFGIERFNDTYAATELLPVGGRTCNQRHLHLDQTMGYVEVVDLDTGEPAAEGSLGSLVVTPYFPFRDCMPVFRYDTRDVVRALPERLDCELSGTPGVSEVVGKTNHMLLTTTGPVSRRDILEVLDGLPDVEWPVRYQASVDDDGRLRVRLATDRHTAATVTERFAEAGLDVIAEVVAMSPEEAGRFCRLRCDLHERTFTRDAA